MTNSTSAGTFPAGYRIAQVGIGTESSTFAPHRTGDDDFTVVRGEEVHANAAHFTDHRLADFPQVEFVPLMDARAMPGGPVLPETFDRLTGEMVDLLAAGGPFDAVYLRLHGALNVVGRLDAEAEFVRRVRAVVGDDVLISASMDLHGQVSEELFRSVDVLTCYRTAPHLDYAETQERACRDLAHYLTEGIRPVRALVRVPVLLPGEMTSTRLEPAESIYASLADDRHPDGVRDASLWVGYAWADEPRSAAAVVVHGTDEEAVLAEAMRVGQAWFDASSQFVFCAPADEPDALHRAGAGLRPPPVLRVRLRRQPHRRWLRRCRLVPRPAAGPPRPGRRPTDCHLGELCRHRGGRHLCRGWAGCHRRPAGRRSVRRQRAGAAFR